VTASEIKNADNIIRIASQFAPEVPVPASRYRPIVLAGSWSVNGKLRLRLRLFDLFNAG